MTERGIFFLKCWLYLCLSREVIVIFNWFMPFFTILIKLALFKITDITLLIVRVLLDYYLKQIRIFPQEREMVQIRIYF